MVRPSGKWSGRQDLNLQPLPGPQTGLTMRAAVMRESVEQRDLETWRAFHAPSSTHPSERLPKILFPDCSPGERPDYRCGLKTDQFAGSYEG